MNPQTLLRLCSFTYLNLPELYARRLGRGETVTLAEVACALRRLDDLGALSCGAYLENAGRSLPPWKNRLCAYLPMKTITWIRDLSPMPSGSRAAA